jgi:hypothetical protein
MEHAINDVDRAGARACWRAAVCLEAAVFALMAILHDLEHELGESRAAQGGPGTSCSR